MLAVGVVELLGAGGVEGSHLGHQRLTDARQEHLVGQLLAQYGARGVAKRGADEGDRVDHRAVQVEDDRVEAGHPLGRLVVVGLAPVRGGRAGGRVGRTGPVFGERAGGRQEGRDRLAQPPALEQLERPRVDQVEVQGRDGDVAGGESGEIGAGLVGAVALLAVDGVAAHGAVAGLEDDALVDAGAAQPCDLHAAHVGGHQVGQVDVEHEPVGQAVGQHAGDDRHRQGDDVVDVSRRASLNRDGHGRQAEKSALEGRGHGTRVGHVVAQVGAHVGAGDDDPGARAEEPQGGRPHAVGRRAVEREAREAVAEPGLAGVQGTIDRDAAGDGAAVAVGRQGQDRAQRIEPAPQRSEAGGVDAVVVGQQDVAHGACDSTARSGVARIGNTRRGARQRTS